MIKNKMLIPITLGATVLAIILNFQELLSGSQATFKNLIVTLAYLAVWLVVLFIGSKKKSQCTIKYICVFWLITLAVSLLTLYVNFFDATVNWAIPFVIVFLGPLYGARFFVSTMLAAALELAIVSFILTALGFLLLKRIKQA